MARRRRGGAVKTARKGKRGQKKESEINGIADENTAEDINDVNEGGCTNDSTNFSESGPDEPIVHHKKFGKIHVAGQSKNMIELDSPTNDCSKDDMRLSAKFSGDGEKLASIESNSFSNEGSVIDLIRGIEMSGGKCRNNYSDFRKQSSVYKVENDIPLDGSVIIKPGTFSSNTISSSVKTNSFFDGSSHADLPSVNFFKVLQGIEMLERKVSTSPEFSRSLEKCENEFLVDNANCQPVFLDNNDVKATNKNVFPNPNVVLTDIKLENCNNVEFQNNEIEKMKIDNMKSMEISSPDDTTLSDIQNDTDDAIKKIENIILDETRENSDSPVSKTSDEIVMEKKPSIIRNRTGSTDTTSSESSSNCGTGIRRSNRIRSIGMMKQKEREHAVSKAEKSEIRSPVAGGSPAATPPVPGYDDKPVKVKSRWRRSSELEMHGGKNSTDMEVVSSTCPSPVNSFPSTSASSSCEPTPEEVERIEREKKEVEDGLRSFTILTENEYKMERSACKETKRMICDCALSKEEIERGEVGCGEDCLNRMLFLECGSRCALGERCTNKRFQKLQYANCKIFKTEKKGFGLRAEEDLPGNTFIMEYVGEVVDQKEFARRVKLYAKDNNKHFYFMALKGDAVIDATIKGNISRFINHSCDPNAETQKWTINGELRVGFFTRRFVPAGEEITFDYQFQRYGKEAQKCYCEAPSCRGWIGENPDGVDEDDEDDEEEEEEEDEDDEEELSGTGGVPKEGESDDEKDKTWSKGDEAKEKKSEPLRTKSVTEKKAKVPRRKRNLEKKKERKTAIVDDMGLEEEIQKLFQTGLKNRAHTLSLSRLMVRAEDWSTKSKLLQLIREGETPCRRLFLDYHGLRLICSWMVSQELEESKDRDERKIEILKTLAKLPIPNKNMLIDSKVLSVVEQWAKSACLVRKFSVDEEIGSEELKKTKSEDVIPGLGGEIESSADNEKNKQSENNETVEELGEYAKKVKSMAESVLESWSPLKEVFRIPKKERIEQMKEHERLADRGYSEYLDNKENFRDKYDRHDRYGRQERFRIDRIRDRKRVRDSPPETDRFRNHDRKLSKHERRQLFALKVLQEDEEAKKRNEHLEMWKQHESHCLALGLDPKLNAARDPQTGYPVFYDQITGSWQNCPASAGPSPALSHPVTPSMCPSPLYPMAPPGVQNSPLCSNMPVCSNINQTICQNMCHGGMMSNVHVNGNACTSIATPTCLNQPYTGVGYESQSAYDESAMAAGYHSSLPPEPVPVPYNNIQEIIPEDLSQPILTSVPLNAPIKLPPKWKSAKDSKGRVYYYHVKIRVSQWEPPEWTEEEARIEAAKAVAAEMEDSTSSSESSSETSSEDEEEEQNGYAEDEAESEAAASAVGNEADSESFKAEATSSETRNSSSEVRPTGKQPENGDVEGNVDSPNDVVRVNSLDDEKDEDLSAWEDEEDYVKPKAAQEPQVSQSTVSSAPAAAQVPTSTTATASAPAKGRRVGLVQEIIISPRREEDRVDPRRYKEVKEMLRRQKEEERRKEKMARVSRGEKASVRLSKSKKKRKEKISRSSRVKFEKPTSAAADTSTDRKIKENFKNLMAGAIVSHLNPYRKQDCKVGRITCNEDFKHLARKLTHFVMVKELRHCRGVDDLECNDSVKAKAKDFIKKYMAKFGAVYQRPQHDVWKA
ncbi:UNVERIFIED_CONTAM: hypothetical protein PYX00_006522 [Menopon gallinae]|uniref:[histone H3]-lysine(36) N-trimethyltransferase n=1 Tax=Menopon gallinae TaxID=328185 RepID=A0AAW2HVS5_9NEOP